MSTSTFFIEQRLKILENLPSGLPPSEILSKGIYAPIGADKRLSKKIWTDFRDFAIAYADARAFDDMRMGMWDLIKGS